MPRLAPHTHATRTQVPSTAWQQIRRETNSPTFLYFRPCPLLRPLTGKEISSCYGSRIDLMRVIGDVASAQVVQSGNRRRGEGVWSISICLGCGRMRDNDAINNVAKQEGQTCLRGDSFEYGSVGMWNPRVGCVCV